MSISEKIETTNNKMTKIKLPMDTYSSIPPRSKVKIPREKFVKISSVLKDKSRWEL